MHPVMTQYRVWYSKPAERNLIEDASITKDRIEVTHVAVSRGLFMDLDDAFMQMQAENWSPGGEARPWIEHLGLRHTSMSVGDVVEDVETGRMYQCAAIGWTPVPEG